MTAPQRYSLTREACHGTSETVAGCPPAILFEIDPAEIRATLEIKKANWMNILNRVRVECDFKSDEPILL